MDVTGSGDEKYPGATTTSQIPSRPPSRATVTTVDTVNDNLNLNRRSTRAGSTKAPGLKWHNEYDEVGQIRPRVLLIEYYRRDVAQQVRKVTAREFKELQELRSVYKKERSEDTILRVFHVQNCSWAENYLMRKHAFDAHAPRVHTSSGNSGSGPNDFSRWVKERIPRRRLGKLMMSSRAWKTHTDPWRGVAKTAFGVDYYKAYSCEESGEQRGGVVGESGEVGAEDRDRVLGLQGFDDDDNTIHAYNVYSQRLSVYVQYKHHIPIIPDPDLFCPYGNNPSEFIKRYDNGNTILIIDNSHNDCIYDTLIPARGHVESKWRRLPFAIATPSGGIEADKESSINLHCMKVIVRDIFKALVMTWEKVLEVSWEHVSILEDAIYEQPADESRAPELWRNSAFWNRYEKLMFYHVDTMDDIRRYLTEFTDVGDSVSEAGGNGAMALSEKGGWLEEIPADFDKLGNLIQEDLVKPTASLSELMYRSVAIRDSRDSLRLGSSMWRLSWITFIFLPATFMVGFFGMNVETFAGEGFPDIKWFFIVLFPFFAVVFIGWYTLKHLLAKNRRAPIQRGLYEALYTNLEEQNPSLWTRQGPREYVVPADWVSRVKWRLIRYWAKGDSKAMKPGEVNEPIGGWERIKRWLMKRWTREIKIERENGVGIGTKRLLGGEELVELGTELTAENPNEGRLVPMGRVIVTDVDNGPGSNEIEQRPEAGNELDATPMAPMGGNVTFASASVMAPDEDSEILVEERKEGEGVTEEEGEIRQMRSGGFGHRLTVARLFHRGHESEKDREAYE